MAPTPASSSLSSSSIASYIVSSLPKNTSPQLRSSTDAVAIACHAGMLAVGFRLVGLGEDHGIGELRVPASLALSTPDRTLS